MAQVTALLPREPNRRWLGVAIVVGGAAAAIGSRLNWPARNLFGSGVPGSIFPDGTRAFWLGVLCILAGLVLLFLKKEGVDVVAASIAALAGAIVGWGALRAGFAFEPALGIGIYLTSAGAAAIVVASVTHLALSLGMPLPGFSVGAGIGLIALGVFGWIFNFVAANAIRAAGGSRFLIACTATLLLLSGIGVLAQRTWAWLLALAVSTFGVVGNGLTALRVEELRAPSYLAAFMYFTALRSLWRTRGPTTAESGSTPEAPDAAPTTSDQPTASEDASPAPIGEAPPPQPPRLHPPEGEKPAVGSFTQASFVESPPLAPDVAPSSFSRPTYLKRCLHPAYFEQPEERSWQNDPSLRVALDPLNAGDHRRAADEADGIIQRVPDLDLGYWWRGTALLRIDDVASARDVIRRGLSRANRKFLLLEQLGEIEWKARDLHEAVYAWSQAIHCQEPLEHHGGDVGAYLNLHYVAEGIGLPDAARAFLGRVDAIRFGGVRLEPSSAADLVALARTDNEGVPEVLRGLHERYLGTAKALA